MSRETATAPKGYFCKCEDCSWVGTETVCKDGAGPMWVHACPECNGSISGKRLPSGYLLITVDDQ